jgi:hypothetical protein
MWFTPGTPLSSTNKTDRHDITEILLKVTLNTITLTLYFTLLSATYETKSIVFAIIYLFTCLLIILLYRFDHI